MPNMSFKSRQVTKTVDKIEVDLGQRLSKIRLSHNLTQVQLAQTAGTSVRTLIRLEAGHGVSLDVFIKVLIALRLETVLESLPDPAIRPLERIKLKGHERQRARPSHKETPPASQWAWGDEDL